MARPHATDDQHRIRIRLDLAIVHLRQQTETTFPRDLAIERVRDNLHRIDRVARMDQPVGRAENLHGRDQVKLFDRRHDQQYNSPWFVRHSSSSCERAASHKRLAEIV